MAGDKAVGVSTAAEQFLAGETVVIAGVLSSQFEYCLNFDLGLTEEGVAFGKDLVDVPSTLLRKPYVGRPEKLRGAIVAVGHDVNAISLLAVGQRVTKLVSFPNIKARFELKGRYSARDIPWAGV